MGASIAPVLRAVRWHRVSDGGTGMDLLGARDRAHTSQVPGVQRKGFGVDSAVHGARPNSGGRLLGRTLGLQGMLGDGCCMGMTDTNAHLSPSIQWGRFTRAERLARMTPERRDLYERIVRRRNEIGCIDVDLGELLRELRDE